VGLDRASVRASSLFAPSQAHLLLSFLHLLVFRSSIFSTITNPLYLSPRRSFNTGAILCSLTSPLSPPSSQTHSTVSSLSLLINHSLHVFRSLVVFVRLFSCLATSVVRISLRITRKKPPSSPFLKLFILFNRS
jgi:hypothetical protein